MSVFLGQFISGSVLLLSTTASSSVALASEPNRYRTDNEDLAWIRSAHPHAGELFDQGETALYAGDAAKAAELLGQAAEEAPQSALAPRRQCEALVEIGRHAEAVEACRKAVANQGTAMDLRAMVAALMSGTEPPTTEEMGYAIMYARRARQIMSKVVVFAAPARAEMRMLERVSRAALMIRACSSVGWYLTG